MAEPIRTCIGCRRKSTKWELIRLVRNELGQVLVDESGKKPGRGAYVCSDFQCINLALTPKKLNKILKTDLGFEEIEHLKQMLLVLLRRDQLNSM
jgi:predicted RNA-binding protein YlxR (DUF448 family)